MIRIKEKFLQKISDSFEFNQNFNKIFDFNWNTNEHFLFSAKTSGNVAMWGKKVAQTMYS